MNQCTAETRSGTFCERPAIPDAPFPICMSHATKLYMFVRDLFDDADDEQNRSALLRLLIGTGTWSPSRRRAPVVYYARVGSLIKIGTTSDLRTRIMTYPPRTLLLAQEPGGEQLEAQRLDQFRDSL